MENKLMLFRDYLIANLGTYLSANNLLYSLLPLDTPNGIVIGYPGEYIDTHRGKCYLYIQGPIETREHFTSYQIASRDIKIYLVVRGDTIQNLYEKVERYTDCIKELVHADNSLGSIFDMALISECHGFDGIEGSPNTKGMEIQLQTQYQD